jgi:hypothetical protein
MARISARTASWAKWAVVPVALLVGGVAVSQASYSAFSDSTATPASNWAAGTVKLANDAPAATAMFSATNLKPGDTGTKCIAVTSTGSLASAVKLYATGAATTNALSSNVNLTITQGTGGGFGSCTGFTALATGAAVYTGTLAALGTSATGFSNGIGAWAPTGTAPETHTYQITYTLDTAAPNTTQGGTAALGFTWEAQNS